MIEGKRVTLRGLELSDSSELLSYWNEKEFLDFSGRTSPLTKEEIQTWIKQTWTERKRGYSHTFGVIFNEDSLLIGYIKLQIVNNISKRGKLSIGIFNPTYRDRGLGTETMELMIDYAFFTLNLQSLELNVFNNNQRAISCYKKIGFREIGLRRKADFVNGMYVDDLIMDLLVEEWRNKT